MLNNTVAKIKTSPVFGVVGIQLFSKLAGIVREIILANFFGPSLLFASYLKLITLGQAVSLFYSEGGLIANLMRKFSVMYKRGMSFSKIRRGAICIGIGIGVAVFILQYLYYVLYMDTEYNFLGLILISAISSSLVFYINIGQIILLSRGNYKNYNRSNFFRALIYIVILYPLISIFNVLGAEINRLVSVFSQYFNTWRVLKERKKVELKEGLSFSYKDFNLWVFLTNNSIFIWYVIFRLYCVTSSNVDIIFFTYGFLLANSIDGLLIKPLANFVLERKLNDSFDLSKVVLFLFVAFGVSFVIAYFFGNYVLELIFNFTDKYTLLEINRIHYFFLLLLVLVFTNGINNVVFQKIFSKRRKSSLKVSRNYFLISIISIIVVFLLFRFVQFEFEFILGAVVCLSIINLLSIVWKAYKY